VPAAKHVLPLPTALQVEKLAAYNMYFDKHGVDVIIAPGQRCDAMTCVADSDPACYQRLVVVNVCPTAWLTSTFIA
jgi:hypothetical protein